MLPEFFEFLLPTRIVYGAGIIDQLTDTVTGFGKRRALLVTDRILNDIGVADRVRKGFSATDISIVATFDDVPPNSTISTVQACARMARQKKCDMIIGLGGGSVMDTAKVANILAVKGGKVEDHMGAYLLGDEKILPHILIPTTAGTGSEVTKVAIIADPENDIKLPFAETQFFPQLAILDPELTQSMPAQLTAATGMDALTHAIESYVSKEAQPASDALALHVIRMINENLVAACVNPDDMQSRGAMLVASCLAGMAFTQSMVGMVHGISHALGGVYHIPHGLANALILPEVMEYNLEECPERYADIAQALGVYFPLPVRSAQSVLHSLHAGLAERTLDRTRFVDRWVERMMARAGIARVRELNRQLAATAGMAVNLHQAGIRDDLFRIKQVVDTAMVDGSMLYNPRDVAPEAVERIVEKVYSQKVTPLAVKLRDRRSAETSRRETSQENVFTDADMLYSVLGDFYQDLVSDPELNPQFLDSNLIVQFRYKEPEAIITIDASGSEIRLHFGDHPPCEPEVTMSMKADFAHQFWQGKANFLTALTKRQVRSKGNIPKAVKLLPILKPAYSMYPQFLEQKGLSQLLH